MFLRILDRLEEILIASLIAAATLLIFVAVVQRYMVGVPFLYPLVYHINLTWAQELCIYMFVWMAKFGAAYGVRTGIHVGVDVVVNMLDPGPRKKVVMFGLLCGALFTFVVGTMGAKFVIELYPTDQVSPDMEMPRWIIFLCVPLGSYLMCFRFLQVAWAFWRTGELPHHDPGHVEGVVESPAAARDVFGDGGSDRPDDRVAERSIRNLGDEPGGGHRQSFPRDLRMGNPGSGDLGFEPRIVVDVGNGLAFEVAPARRLVSVVVVDQYGFHRRVARCPRDAGVGGFRLCTGGRSGRARLSASGHAVRPVEPAGSDVRFAFRKGGDHGGGRIRENEAQRQSFLGREFPGELDIQAHECSVGVGKVDDGTGPHKYDELAGHLRRRQSGRRALRDEKREPGRDGESRGEHERSAHGTPRRGAWRR